MTFFSKPMLQFLSRREAAREDALVRVEWEGSGSEWARAGAAEGDEGKRGATGPRKEVSLCLGECRVIHSV